MPTEIATVRMSESVQTSILNRDSQDNQENDYIQIGDN